MDETKQIVLSARELTKVYSRPRSPFDSAAKDSGDFFALDHVSFDLYKGEILGVIGKNGAGKSTLLKVLSEITSPTSGSVEISGRLTSILDIGSGFHPDLSGRDNIGLSLSLLGISKQEAKKIFNEIVDFSGVNEFIDMPVKYYSSGMYLRLAFSVAFHTKNDILLLDEVLTVGDADFRVKCNARIRELSKNGASIIMINHNLDAIRDFCDRTLLLENGRVSKLGRNEDVIESYIEKKQANPNAAIRSQMPVTGKEQPESVTYSFDFASRGIIEDLIRVTGLKIAALHGKSPGLIYIEEVIEIDLAFDKVTDTDAVEIAFCIRNQNEQMLLIDSFGIRSDYLPQMQKAGKYNIRCQIPGDLLNRGIYTLGMNISRNKQLLVKIDEIARFKVLANDNNPADWKIKSLVRTKLNWKISGPG